ncbi:hypothetical protein [Bradyrhizobium sp. BWA-3-5]|uniref:hypothetical protein n=1 Tax=Bradyrhizobium sp. BWA-3-5 TaxID=3080013 RepID=UPI00293E867F|nr:hypothetical protein [Bradyrhizobium sp. BWA-3-5]WOH63824.1 hypothetical protein RX331_24380 [Bradyrhizobium sp. BWA-3-5]
MKKPDGSKKILLVNHTEGQCRAIVGFENGDPTVPYMCGEPVLRRQRSKMSSWCPYHHGQMHASPVEQYVSKIPFPIRLPEQAERAEVKSLGAQPTRLSRLE